MASAARKPERTREAVLDAAEELFAARGYDGVSLQEIGAAAGVSRATPSYFFGSKEDLYQAVIDRSMAPAQALVTAVRELAGRDEPPETVIAEAVAGYIEFLAGRPTFVRLIGWEAMTGGRFLGESAPHIAVVREGFAAVADELRRGDFRAVDPVQLLISFVALCFFPASHGAMLLAALGVDVEDRAFREARTRHVTELILHGIAAGGSREKRKRSRR